MNVLMLDWVSSNPASLGTSFTASGYDMKSASPLWLLQDEWALYDKSLERLSCTDTIRKESSYRFSRVS